MNRISKIYASIIGLLLLGVGILSCDRMIYDNLKSCPIGVYIHVYEQTECASQPLYPSVKKLQIYAFDENDRYVSTVDVEAPLLSKDHEILFPLVRKGYYSFVVWANVDNHFRTQQLIVGKSTKADLLLALKKDQKSAVTLDSHQVYVGSTPTVQVGDNEEMFFVHTQANIREITNRICVTVTGLLTPKDYIIELSSNNTSYTVCGAVMPDKVVHYPTIMRYTETGDAVARFSTLKLESGRNSILTVKNKNTGKVIFMEDLVGAILLSPSTENINLRCLNDFDVKLKVRKCDCPELYQASQLWINDWLVHQCCPK